MSVLTVPCTIRLKQISGAQTVYIPYEKGQSRIEKTVEAAFDLANAPEIFGENVPPDEE